MNKRNEISKRLRGSKKKLNIFEKKKTSNQLFLKYLYESFSKVSKALSIEGV